MTCRRYVADEPESLFTSCEHAHRADPVRESTTMRITRTRMMPSVRVARRDAGRSYVLRVSPRAIDVPDEVVWISKIRRTDGVESHDRLCRQFEFARAQILIELFYRPCAEDD